LNRAISFIFPRWESKELCPTGSQKIPKKLHQIWFDFNKGLGKNVTQKYLKYSKRWIELHPDWDYHLWTEMEVIDLIKIHFPEFLKTFLSYDKMIKKHDASRIIILAVFGGVYIDHDIIPIKNIEPLLGRCSFVISVEPAQKCINSFMGAVKNLLFFKILVKELMSTANLRDVLPSTGPDFISMNIVKYAKMIPGIMKVYDQSIGHVNYTLFRSKDPEIKDILRLYPNVYFFSLFDFSWA
jgi:mannosyltransferase OCH1-like enzyme